MENQTLKASQQIVLNSPRQTVWDIVGNFKDLSWVKGIVSCDADGWGEGAVRIAVSKDGQETKEKCLRYDEDGCSYSYSVIDPDLIKSYVGTMTVKDSESRGGSQSIVIWECEINCGNFPKEKIAGFIEKFYRDSLLQLEQRLATQQAATEA